MNASSVVIQPRGFPNNSAMALKLPQGDAGVVLTIAAMTAIVHDAVQNSAIVRDVAAALQRSASRDGRDVGEEVYWWLVQRVRFQRDPQGVEKLRTPDQMLTTIHSAGFDKVDCDELATLAAALLRVMGKFPAFIVMSLQPKRPFHHVFYGLYDVRAGAAAAGPLPGIKPFNPQERTPPGQWPDGARFKAFRI